MIPFEIEIKDSAVKFIRAQDAKTQRLLKQKIENIAADPLNIQHSKWLAGHENVRSARVGSNRIIFTVDLVKRALTIQRIDSRGQVYSRF